MVEVSFIHSTPAGTSRRGIVCLNNGNISHNAETVWQPGIKGLFTVHISQRFVNSRRVLQPLFLLA